VFLAHNRHHGPDFLPVAQVLCQTFPDWAVWKNKKKKFMHCAFKSSQINAFAERFMFSYSESLVNRPLSASSCNSTVTHGHTTIVFTCVRKPEKPAAPTAAAVRRN
jgi:hypothetical protein